MIYKRESGLLNPLEHVSNIFGDSIHVELGKQQVNESHADEFCDVSASKKSPLASFSLGTININLTHMLCN